MPYLLTEIALEMLGYKFYDINGNPGLSSFQDKVLENNANSRNVPTTEESLASIVKFSTKSSNDKKADETPSCETKVVQSQNSCIKPQSELPPDEKKDDKRKMSSDSKCANNLQNDLAIAHPRENRKRAPMWKIFESEHKRIRAQIMKNKNIFLQSNTEMLKRIEQRGSLARQEGVMHYEMSEKSNLLRDLHTMQKFRTMVEQTLETIDPQTYEKYVQSMAHLD